MTRPIRVAAAAIMRGPKVLLARRAPGSSWAGWWELPGGKLEPGESAQDCLRRELGEELGILARIGAPLVTTFHLADVNEGGANRAWPPSITITVFQVDAFDGEITPRVHDALQWCLPADFVVTRILPADLLVGEVLASG